MRNALPMARVLEASLAGFSGCSIASIADLLLQKVVQLWSCGADVGPVGRVTLAGVPHAELGIDGVTHREFDKRQLRMERSREIGCP